MFAQHKFPPLPQPQPQAEAEAEAQVVATTRRLQLSDSGAFADWVASSSAGDLSLGFNAAPTPAAAPTTVSASTGMWSSTPARQIGLPPEFFFVAPASSFPNHNHHPDAAATINFDPHSHNAGIGLIPLCLGADDDALDAARGRGSAAGMQLWQQNHHQLGLNSPASYLRKPVIINADHHGDLLLSGGGNIGGGGGAATCQDCGNQAKKDCTHRRCRSCCKSRGFDCSTHVKSTWVPAVRRRERQLMGSNTAAVCSQSQSTSSAKKPRLAPAGASQTTSHTSTSNNNDTSSSHQDTGSMPGQLSAPAVFKCVRVTAVDDGEDEYAYQAVVRIGGHVFKGFLYDQGFDQGLFPNMSDLHLGAARNGGSSSNQVVDPTHDLYTGGGGMIGGSNYGNTIN